jgi:hypothetical protein
VEAAGIARAFDAGILDTFLGSLEGEADPRPPPRHGNVLSTA